VADEGREREQIRVDNLLLDPVAQQGDPKQAFTISDLWQDPNQLLDHQQIKLIDTMNGYYS